MNNRFKKSWFTSTHEKVLLNKFIEDEKRSACNHFMELPISKQDDQLYMSSVLSGVLTSLNYVQFLCGDNTCAKPWIVRGHNGKLLEFRDFRARTDDVVKWLNAQPPSREHAKLIYIQTIISFLTTMEFNDE